MHYGAYSQAGELDHEHYKFCKFHGEKSRKLLESNLFYIDLWGGET